DSHMSGFALSHRSSIALSPGSAYVRVRTQFLSRSDYVSLNHNLLEMTSPKPPRPRAQSDGPFDTMSEWFELYNKQITWGVVGVAVVAAGIWFYSRSQTLKEEKAERALNTTLQSVPGNYPLAESDLRKLIQRYDGTTAGYQAQLALARVLYDEGKYNDGIESLKNGMPKLDKSKDFESAGHLLLAAGYEQSKKFL